MDGMSKCELDPVRVGLPCLIRYRRWRREQSVYHSFFSYSITKQILENLKTCHYFVIHLWSWYQKTNNGLFFVASEHRWIPIWCSVVGISVCVLPVPNNSLIKLAYGSSVAMVWRPIREWFSHWEFVASLSRVTQEDTDFDKPYKLNIKITLGPWQFLFFVFHSFCFHTDYQPINYWIARFLNRVLQIVWQ